MDSLTNILSHNMYETRGRWIHVHNVSLSDVFANVMSILCQHDRVLPYDPGRSLLHDPRLSLFQKIDHQIGLYLRG